MNRYYLVKVTNSERFEHPDAYPEHIENEILETLAHVGANGDIRVLANTICTTCDGHTTEPHIICDYCMKYYKWLEKQNICNVPEHTVHEDLSTVQRNNMQRYSKKTPAPVVKWVTSAEYAGLVSRIVERNQHGAYINLNDALKNVRIKWASARRLS